MSNRTIQSIALRVRELAPARRFYHDLVGLEVFSETDDRVLLGTGGDELVTLLASADARERTRSEGGLFHLAIRFPDRRSLADVLARLSRAAYPLAGASDHDVSEALYTNDPGGNGVELYRDRPESAWERDASGEVRMTTRRLDIDDLRSQASSTTPDVAPEGTSLGHVHLEVSDLERAIVFYRELLGMELQTSRPGAAFLSWDDYHHHVGLNTWNHRRQPNDPEALGMDAVTARVSEDETDAIRARAEKSDVLVERDDGALSLNDPDGIRWRIRPSGP